ncbi:MAG TPA: CopG family transcriptional regulator [Terriglobia bacterium]|nr:CopG family transcriptional regulator [Terriglobia bacterium]
MAKRLQVILKDPEYREVKRAARSRQMSIAEWVRQALEQAHRGEPAGRAGKKLEVIRAAARGDYPTADIDHMLAEIELGYGSGAHP